MALLATPGRIYLVDLLYGDTDEGNVDVFHHRPACMHCSSRRIRHKNANSKTFKLKACN